MTKGRRIRLRFLALLALTSAIAIVATWVREVEAGPRRAVAVGVAEREFTISAYRRTVPPGRVRFNVTNFGEDTHNLVIRGPRGYTATSEEIRAGRRTTLETTLRRPGTYRLLCTQADHLGRGMRTKIVVRRPR
jgi:plastocyanin